MSEKENLNASESEEEYFEDLQQNLSTFPTEIYNISSLELIESSTPSVSPNISPSSIPKPGTVKTYLSLFEDLDTDNSSISSRTRNVNSRRKMGKIQRHQRAFRKYSELIDKELQDLRTALDENKIKETKEQTTKLKQHKMTLEKDLAALADEEVEESEEEPLDNIKLDMKTFLAKLSVEIMNAKEYLETSSKTAIAGKISSVDIPTFDGDYLKYKHYKLKFKTLTSTYDETSQRVFLVDKSLKGEAYKYVEDLIVHGGSLKAIWEQLDAHYGNEHHVIDATISAFFQQEKPSKDINKF